MSKKRARKKSIGLWILAVVVWAMIASEYPLIAVLILIFGAVFAVWYFWLRKRPKKEQKKDAETPSNVAKASVDYSLPSRIGDCLRLYQYFNLRAVPSDNAVSIAKTMQAANKWTFDAREEDGSIVLYFDGQFFGKLLDRVDMVKDWMHCGDPLIIGLKNIKDDDGQIVCIVFAVFYRDEQKRMAWRENEVVKLVKTANNEAQEKLECVQNGDLCELRDDYDTNNNDIGVVDVGGEIGQLPKKQAERFCTERCAGAFVDHVDFDDDTEKYIPYIKIYW